MAVRARRQGGAVPSAPQPMDRDRKQLLIASSPLLRGEREDIALLNDRTLVLLEEVAAVLDRYNASIETSRSVVVPGSSVPCPFVEKEAVDAFDELDRLATDLSAAV